MSEFSRDISLLKTSLEQLAGDGSRWWADVLLCDQLMLAIRGGYLNAYVNGQSIFKVSTRDGRPIVETHYKYLLRPKAKTQYVRFDGGKFILNAENYIQSEYKSGETLPELIRAANLYSMAEKRGVHAIAQTNDNVLDVEIAFRAPRAKQSIFADDRDPESQVANGKDSTYRIDLAAIHPTPNGASIVFYEAKCADNVELWKTEERNGERLIEVLIQIDRYEMFLKRAEPALIQAYRNACKAFAWLSKEQGWVKRLNPLVARVANDEIDLSIHPKVHLLIFDFDAAQKKHAVAAQVTRLRETLGRRVVAKGDLKKFSLLKDVDLSE
jgi:hypothetical protein